MVLAHGREAFHLAGIMTNHLVPNIIAISFSKVTHISSEDQGAHLLKSGDSYLFLQVLILPLFDKIIIYFSCAENHSLDLMRCVSCQPILRNHTLESGT